MKRHSSDLVSMVFGLVFLLVAALWPLWQLSLLDNNSITWVPATALILIGLIGLALSIARARAPRSAVTAPDLSDVSYGSSAYEAGAYGTGRYGAEGHDADRYGVNRVGVDETEADRGETDRYAADHDEADRYKAERYESDEEEPDGGVAAEGLTREGDGTVADEETKRL